ncbi:MAG: HIRAN domain-containing protein [Victivallaceae bacterium]|nr:HIRAN domain-containing protein [Victivallaceae bacterium]
MKFLNRKSTWQRLSYVPTWIVGSNYYDGKIKTGEQVLLKPEPKNHADPLAMAIYNHKQQQIGYLPRYDAAIFTPALNNGEVKLKGTPTALPNGGRIALQLEVFLAPQAESWLSPAFGDDIKDIYHNNLLNVWNNLEHYSAETITAFRDSMRSLAHNNQLHYYTAILYRLLRGMVGELQESEQTLYRQLIADRISQLGYGKQLGSKELTVFPLFDTAKNITRYKSPMRLPEQLELTPENLLLRYPYPADAVGAVYYVGNEFEQFYYSNSAAKMQINWFKFIEAIDCSATIAGSPVKQHQLRRILLAMVKNIELDFYKHNNATVISSTIGDFELDATVKDGELIELSVTSSYWQE